MASTSSSCHAEIKHVDVSGQGSEENVLGEESASTISEHIQEIPHEVSAATATESRNKPPSLVANWLLGFVHYVGGILGLLISFLPIIKLREHEKVKEPDCEVIRKPRTLTVDSGNIPESQHDLESKHKVFLSHSGAQKDFVEQLCVDLERCDRFPFFDKLQSSIPVGEKFPKLIFDAIEQCQVGVVILSEDFFMKSKWPMLELNAMIKKLERHNSRITIIPLFYQISIEAFKNPKNHSRWILQWKKWASIDKRINVEEWKKVLRVMKTITSIVAEKGISDVSLREGIVAEICRLVPSETRYDNSHIQGCSRICKVIQHKIDQVMTTSKNHIIGLYGMGGIGKTTIGKALCNELSSKFHDKVCHIEFGSGTEMELLRKTLKTCTQIRHDVLDELDDISQGFSYLRRRISTQKVFLVLDNVQDNYKSIQVAQAYLKGGYGPGSFILITTRTIDVLKKLHLDGSNSFEMPDLEEDEARSLILNCSISLPSNEINEEFVKNSIKQCYFSKGDGTSKHYHPLALKVLSQQLGSNSTLQPSPFSEINTFNGYGHLEHPIFSILRSTFDSLRREHQLVFMDLALLASKLNTTVWPIHWNQLDWLCMVHDKTTEEIKDMLEVLKRKLLVEDLGGGFTKIGIHDLWIEFAVEEAKPHSFRDQLWVYQEDGKRAALQRRGRWRESVERMCFFNLGFRSLDGLKLDDFVNLTVFALVVDIHMPDCALNLDLSGLVHLKSLQICTRGMSVRAHGLNFLTSLVELLWCTPGTPCLDEIGRLKSLQYLKLRNCMGINVLNFTELKFLKVVKITKFPDLITIRGFSSRLTNLRSLLIKSCKSLQNCPGLDELYSLEELSLLECSKLPRLPCLGQLTNLKECDLSQCESLEAVPGLSELVALEKFSANGCRKLAPLPDLVKLTKLQELRIEECLVQCKPGVASLFALASLRPSLSKLSVLEVITISKWNGLIWTSIPNLPMLRKLKLRDCEGDDEVPDLQSLKRLKSVKLESCDYKDLLGLSTVTALETLYIHACNELKRLPEFERLTKLRQFHICGRYLDDIRDWPSASDMCSLEVLSVDEISSTKIVPDHESLSGLRKLKLYGSGCENVLSMASSSQLEFLSIYYFETTEELDFSGFPNLRELVLWRCGALKRLTCSKPLTALNRLQVENCVSLVEMPNLSSTFPHLENLFLKNCRALSCMTCSGPLLDLKNIELIGCDRRIEMPYSVSTFPKLKCYIVGDSSS
ncbi:hypothetical protein KC19_12G058100 [Ceratodon purpureus]|uniref:TIR domain-containing protein n=1 Tax=Ceratodon purpureus TaxID=3225 RepID=A0A8T0G9S9_CERPU|nr:hypothetical protein KC19_12G058100 [Ceratodon purpureus]